MTPNWNKTIAREMIRARRTLGAAQLLLKGGFLEDATSRAYYGVLHAAKAALGQHQCAPKTHQGTQRMFAKLMVNNGLIEPEYSGIFSEEHDNRELCDYTANFEMAELDAYQVVADAAKFIDRIERYLKDQKTVKDGVTGHSPATTSDDAAMKVREAPSPAYRAKRARPGAKGREGRR